MPRVHRILLLAFVLLVAAAGVVARDWTWKNTKHLRFQHDIINGFHWGKQTLQEARRLSPDEISAASWGGFLRGYLGLYERVQAEAYEKQYQLDYPPLRLLVMSVWTKHAQKQFPGAEDGKPEYVEPLLRFNLLCEAISAVAIFFLVRLWVNRASGATRSRFMHRVPVQSRGWVCGLAAATFAWLDPSMILDAHGWPQWDVWILPFYLLAALAASSNRWFWCGCLIAFGAMLKGQLLLVAPFFIFWPLWHKRWHRALQVIMGMAITIALLVSPWMLWNPRALLLAVILFFICALGSFHLPARRSPQWWAGIVAAAIFAAGLFAGGSFAWLRIGFLYGSEHYPLLFISSCYNLPSLLSDLGFALKDSLFSLDFGWLRIGLNLQWGLRLLYLTALAFCALGAARHARHRDPRILIALAAPWLVMFALLGQMHERYLLWGGVVSTLALGVSIRMSVISLIVSIASTAMIAHVMLLDKKLDATAPMIALLDRARPYASWVVLACVAVYFWETLSTRGPIFLSRRRKSPEAGPVALLPAAKQA
jgi:hypothetical protein